MDSSAFNILLVEDDDVDVEAFERAKIRSRLPINVRVASDGILALEILRSQCDHSMIDPCAIVLDLNLPRMSGLEFLAELRKDDELKHHLVFVMSTSGDRRDVEAAQALGVAGYMIKSDEVANLVNLITKMATHSRGPDGQLGGAPDARYN